MRTVSITIAFLITSHPACSFTIPSAQLPYSSSWSSFPTFIKNSNLSQLCTKNTNEDGVIELADDEETLNVVSNLKNENSVAPFLSQGEISEEALNPDLSDPKQTRVIIYIILSLVPVLFLIPLMLGSRDLIPPDALPPVQM